MRKAARSTILQTYNQNKGYEKIYLLFIVKF